MALPSVSAAMARPCMLEVLPWSVAMPLVVKRLTCSIERMPSRTASRMSLAVTSFWKSTKALTVVSGAGAGRGADHAAGPALRRPRPSASMPLPDLPPASFAAFSPAASASAIVAARPSVPLDGADRDAVLRILAGQEALGRIVEGDLAARLREQVHRRRPAGRHQDRVDGDGALAVRRSSAAPSSTTRAACRRRGSTARP